MGLVLAFSGISVAFNVVHLGHFNSADERSHTWSALTRRHQLVSGLRALALFTDLLQVAEDPDVAGRTSFPFR